MANFFTRHGLGIKAAVTMILASTAMAVSLEECEGSARVRAPGLDVTLRGTRSAFKGEGGPLPSGYGLGNNKHYEEVKVKGWTIPICIAWNPTDLTCIYAKLGNCDSGSGWQQFCKASSGTSSSRGAAEAQDAATNPDLTESGTIHQTVRTIRSLDGSVPNDACVDTASFRYDPTTDGVAATFRVECVPIPVPLKLVDTLITSPNGITLPPQEFALVFGGLIPVGSTISFVTTADNAAWNALQLGRTSLESTGSGPQVEAAIAVTTTGVPIWAVGIDGVLVRSGFVFKPS